MEYIFESDFFAISDQGIHLLRNRYNYKTLDFKEIEQVILEEGKLVNNWILLYTIGLIAVGFAVFYSFECLMIQKSLTSIWKK
ncbi:hypothetical protein [Chondrinema litorale]|uniref:hypothetical protein n=1 Tax=Chondrinema litorale TaxID=2994555 RepID=UPI00254273BB|nr:hypothetical protein [Chondrinema litorale]UZR97838.1 hypothetical protein OQ292_28910 [Chondrinema litorale]